MIYDNNENMTLNNNDVLMQENKIRSANNQKSAHNSYSTVAIALLLFAGVSITVQLIIGIAVEVMKKLGVDTDSITILQYIAIIIPIYVVGFPIALQVFKKAPKAAPRSEKMGFGQLLSFWVMCYPAAIILNLLSQLLASALTNGTGTNSVESLLTNINPWQILTVVFLAPIVEELIFRKSIIDHTRQYGEKFAILFSAISFAMFHMNLYQIFYAFALGLIFGYVYTRTGRIRYTMIMHVAFNFMGSVVPSTLMAALDPEILELAGTGDVELIMNSATTEQLTPFIMYGLFIIVEALLIITGLIIMIIKLATKKIVFLPADQEMPKKGSFKTIYVTAGFILFVITCVIVMVYNLTL